MGYLCTQSESLVKVGVGLFQMNW